MLVGWCVGNGINDVPKLRQNNNIFMYSLRFTKFDIIFFILK